MSSRHTQAGSTPIWLLIWLVGMTAIAYWCLVRHLPVLQEQLQSNAQAALTEVGAPDANVIVEGRKATLTGTVATDAQKDTLLSAISSAGGIRTVDNKLNVVEVAVATNDQNAPIVDASNADESDALAKKDNDADAVPAEANADENSSAEPDDVKPVDAEPAEVSAEQETAQTDNTTPPAASSDNDALIDSTAADPTDVAQTEQKQTETEPAPAELSNTAQLAEDVDAKARALIEQAKTNRLQNKQPTTSATAADTQPSVDATKSATFKMRVNDGTLNLTGDLSDQDNLLQFIRAAMTTFDANYVVNSVQVHKDIAPAPWLNSLTQFVTDMKPVSNAGIDLIESQVSLSGIADTEQSHDSVINKALSKLPELSLVERISIAEQDSSTEPTKPEPQTVTEAIPASNNDENTVSEPATTSKLRDDFNALETTAILFESGSDVLATTSLRTIESIAAVFAEYPNTDIEIDGHTDSSGIAANNLELSQLRANAVRDYLIKLGISASRLSAYGFGDGVPIADNSTPAGRKMNRRIEFNF